jgi:hypothetical protein
MRLMFPVWTVLCAAGCDAKEAPQVDKPGARPPQAGNSNPMNEKESRTAAQMKLDSHIVLALKKSRGEPPYDKPTSLDPNLVIEADGRVLVDLNATVSNELLARIESDGGKVINSFEAARAIRALVPLQLMEALASRPDIKFIAPAAQATTNGGGEVPGSNFKS